MVKKVVKKWYIKQYTFTTRISNELSTQRRRTIVAQFNVLEFVFSVSCSTSKIFGFRAGYSTVLFAKFAFSELCLKPKILRCRLPDHIHESVTIITQPKPKNLDVASLTLNMNLILHMFIYSYSYLCLSAKIFWVQLITLTINSTWKAFHFSAHSPQPKSCLFVYRTLPVHEELLSLLSSSELMGTLKN